MRSYQEMKNAYIVFKEMESDHTKYNLFGFRFKDVQERIKGRYAM